MRERIPRWFMVIVGLLLVAVFALPNVADSQGKKKKRKKVVPLRAERAEVGKVRIAFSESSTAIVPLVAMEKGFLKAEGTSS